jgi:DNA-binding protein HU-beta
VNKRELIEIIADEAKLSKKQSKDALNSILLIIGRAINEEGFLFLRGFGKWEVVIRKKRKGRDPITGKKIIIPTKKVIKFRPGKVFKGGPPAHRK